MRISPSLCLVLLLAPRVAGGFVAVGAAELYFSTSGTANPDLTYQFSSWHELAITSHGLFETALPLQFVGTIEQGASGPIAGGYEAASCSQVGTVGNLFFSCANPVAWSDCPAAEGTWFARSVYISPTQGGGFSSGPVIANCPPEEIGPCGEGVTALFRTAIDLETGALVDRAIAAALAPIHLGEIEVQGGKEYIRDEWAVLAMDADGASLTSASSTRPMAGVPEWTAALRAVAPRVGSPPREGTGLRRYLVIQAPQHFGGVRRPHVKFDRRLAGVTRLGPGEQVVLRATFSPRGVLESVGVIEGDAAAAEELAGGLEMVFLEGSEHRVAVYAVFEGPGAPELVAAVPVFPQCCCGEVLCV